MRADVSRRGLIVGAAATGALVTGGCSAGATPGRLGGADMARGHRLRDGRFPPPSGAIEEVGLVIAGGGVAGLAAGWRLAEAGYDDFMLLELEDQPGGNARGARNAISAYPLGAHYLPVPNREAKALRLMLTQFGMIIGERDGVPVYDPYQLCADLEERLLWRGGWQEGLIPRDGLGEAERAQWSAFDRTMAEYRHAAGADGRPAFASPMAYSSEDPRFTALDAQSFAAWLDGKGWVAPPLRAYVRYCCRDDYGTEPEHVSAWAGVHYFAARRGWATGNDGDRELTWPEGNARLVALMTRRLARHIHGGQAVFHVRSTEASVELDSYDAARNRSRRIKAPAAILAMPDFIGTRIHEGALSGHCSYAPWVVANVSVARRPAGKGAPLAWDNVSATSASLGYVVATHQTSASGDGPTVLTWYLPLSDMAPEQARKLLVDRPLSDWQRIVRDDLLTMNPDLEDAILGIDIWRWGHAMVRPTPGFLGNSAWRDAAANPPVFRAHSDLSGLSLFEEAHYRGVVAAENAMRHLAHPFESLI